MERALKVGVKHLRDAELLALIIRTGTGKLSVIDLADQILAEHTNGLAGLALASPQELMKISGVGKSKACALVAAADLARRILEQPTRRRDVVRSADDVVRLLMPELRYEKKEHFVALLLDTKGHVICRENISVGDLATAPVHPREVFSPAVRVSAASVILAHNHPSGDPCPSAEDIETTGRLCKAGAVLGIAILDHIVLGDGIYVSLLSKGLMPEAGRT